MKTIKYFGIVCNPVEYTFQARKFILPDDVEPINITPHTKLSGAHFYGMWLEPNYFLGFSDIEKDLITKIFQLSEAVDE